MNTKTALVTGGTGGIGTTICQKLAKNGFQVVASYFKNGDHEQAKKWQQQQKEAGYDIAISYGDVSDFDSATKLIKEIEQNFGNIDILINNAGITCDRSLKKMSPAEWQKVITANLNSVFNCTRSVINSMIERNFGRIINISSINGQKGQFGQANYAAAKSGIYGITKSLAQEVGKFGITVNAISPGYVATQMVEKMRPDVLEQIVAQIPVGRLGKPEEIADLVCFLSRDESGYITGANIAINGGQHMY